MPTRPRPPSTPRPPRTELRPSAWRRGYDSDWQRLAGAVLSEEPCCRHCGRDGRLAGAELVDHIHPIEDGGARLDRDNLQPLCRDCHAIKTGADIRNRRGIH